MLKFNKVLLASDFDNTLVYTQGALERGEDIPPMSARNREAVEYFIQNGGYFSISTGRALPAFARYAKDLPCNAPCVIANGAAIYDFNKDCYVETAFLDADIYDHVDALLARFDKPACLEAELPETELAARRIGFYERHGFTVNADYPYFQPALTPGGSPIPLHLLTTGGARTPAELRAIETLVHTRVYGKTPAAMV